MVRKAGAFLKKMVWACLNGEPDNNNEQQYNIGMMKQLNKLTELQLSAIIFPIVTAVGVMFYFGVFTLLLNLIK